MVNGKKRKKVVEDEQQGVYTGNAIYWSSKYKEYLQNFIVNTPEIKRIAVIGLGDGMLLYHIHLISRPNYHK